MEQALVEATVFLLADTQSVSGSIPRSGGQTYKGGQPRCIVANGTSDTDVTGLRGGNDGERAV